MKKSTKKKLTKKRILIAAAALLIILGAGGYLFAKNRNSSTTNTADTGVNEVNYNPPTEEEQAQAEDRKEDIIKQNEQIPQTTTDSGKKQVTVVITNARTSDQDIVVNAYVQGVFEDGGTCTATFTKGSSKVTKTSEAFADASTTNCAPFIIQRSEFASSGDWQLVVSYSSPTSAGSSQTKTITL